LEKELLEALYTTMIRYIPAKEKQGAVDHAVEMIIEAGADEELLEYFGNIDKYAKRSVMEQADLDSDYE